MPSRLEGRGGGCKPSKQREIIPGRGQNICKSLEETENGPFEYLDMAIGNGRRGEIPRAETKKV